MKYNGYTLTAKDVLKIFAALSFMGILTFVVMKAAFTPIPSITSEQFATILNEEGYPAYDSIAEWTTESPGWSYKECTSYKDSSLRFDFVVFDSGTVAANKFSSIASYLTSIPHGDDYVEGVNGRESRANFNFWTLEANGRYYHLMRIDNTLFYAISTVDRESEVLKMASKLGYIKPQNIVEIGM